MPCFTPLDGWMSSTANKDGVLTVTFDKALADKSLPVQVPCGRCEGCRFYKRKKLGVQVYHESLMHGQSCMATFTYTDDHCPNGIVKEDMQKCIKRMRGRPHHWDFKYLVAGELGENTDRPHFHMAIIGKDFLEAEGFQDVGKGQHTHESLTDVWGKGFVHIVPLTIERCMYVTGYCMKKVGDVNAWHSHSQYLGKSWVEKYWKDIDAAGGVIIGGDYHPVPSPYFEWAEGKLEGVKERQKDFMLTRFKDDAAKWKHRKSLENQQQNFKAMMALKGGKQL